MLLSIRRNGLDSLSKEVRVFKVSPALKNSCQISLFEVSARPDERPCLITNVGGIGCS